MLCGVEEEKTISVATTNRDKLTLHVHTLGENLLGCQWLITVQLTLHYSRLKC